MNKEDEFCLTFVCKHDILKISEIVCNVTVSLVFVMEIRLRSYGRLIVNLVELSCRRGKAEKADKRKLSFGLDGFVRFDFVNPDFCKCFAHYAKSKSAERCHCIQ